MLAERVSTISDLLNWATLQLEGGAILSPLVEAERIIGDATGLSRAGLYLDRGRSLSASEIGFIENAIKERLGGKPLQYILGHQQFRHLDLKCREGVLIPRPETELLVDEALKELKSLGGHRVVLDIGCGTGAIALSIAQEYGGAYVYAIDASPDAIELTRENALRGRLLDRIEVLQSNLFGELGSLKGQLDMVVSNPPYIPRGELKSLQREVQFEPQFALDGGEDGLDFYHLISEQSPAFLKSGGSLILEVGLGQAPEVAEMIETTGCFADISLVLDYQGIERIVKARRL